MGQFTKLEKSIREETKRHSVSMMEIVAELDKIRQMFKETPREKLDRLEKEVKLLKDKHSEDKEGFVQDMIDLNDLGELE